MMFPENQQVHAMKRALYSGLIKHVDASLAKNGFTHQDNKLTETDESNLYFAQYSITYCTVTTGIRI